MLQNLNCKIFSSIALSLPSQYCQTGNGNFQKNYFSFIFATIASIPIATAVTGTRVDTGACDVVGIAVVGIAERVVAATAGIICCGVTITYGTGAGSEVGNPLFRVDVVPVL